MSAQYTLKKNIDQIIAKHGIPGLAACVVTNHGRDAAMAISNMTR